MKDDKEPSYNSHTTEHLALLVPEILSTPASSNSSQELTTILNFIYCLALKYYIWKYLWQLVLALYKHNHALYNFLKLAVSHTFFKKCIHDVSFEAIAPSQSLLENIQLCEQIKIIHSH